MEHATERCSWERIKISLVNISKAIFFNTKTIVIFIFAPCLFIPFFWNIPAYPREIPYQHLEILQQKYSIKNLMYNDPYIKNQLFPNSLWGVLVFVVPTIVHFFVLVCSKNEYPLGESIAFYHGAFLSIGNSEFIAEIVKNYVGYLRPNTYQMLGSENGDVTCSNGDINYSENWYKVHHSFPSGHAVMGASVFFYLSLYLLGKVQPCRPQDVSLNNFLIDLMTFLSFTPYYFGIWVAASRVREHYHHPADIIMGLFIGTIFACIWYFRYFQNPFGISETAGNAIYGRTRVEERLPTSEDIGEEISNN